MPAPLAVAVGLKVPQAAAGAQLQFTPPLAVSFWTVAATLAVPPVPSTAGGIVDSATERGWGAGPDALPPPQPEIVARRHMGRNAEYLFMAPLQKWQTLQFDLVLELA